MFLIKNLTLVAALAATLCLAQACGEKKESSTEVAEDANEAMIDSNATSMAGEDKDDKEDAAEFMVAAAEGDMFEIALSNLAMERGTLKATKDMAKMLLADHTKSLEEMKSIAQAKGVMLPATLSADKQSKVDELAKKTGADFDQAFASILQDDHKKDVSMYEEEEKDMTDPEVKAYITKSLPVLRSHLTMAEKGEDRADQTKDNKDKM